MTIISASTSGSEPDPELRDTESVLLKEKIEDYYKREVLPHVPDAWIDYENFIENEVLPQTKLRVAEYGHYFLGSVIISDKDGET